MGFFDKLQFNFFTHSYHIYLLFNTDFELNTYKYLSSHHHAQKISSTLLKPSNLNTLTRFRALFFPFISLT